MKSQCVIFILKHYNKINDFQEWAVLDKHQKTLIDFY